jgi:FtsZ-binding cell division protein ZapB
MAKVKEGKMADTQCSDCMNPQVATAWAKECDQLREKNNGLYRDWQEVILEREQLRTDLAQAREEAKGLREALEAIKSQTPKTTHHAVWIHSIIQQALNPTDGE